MTVYIKDKANKKLNNYTFEITESEIGGLLLGKVSNGNIIVKDAIILKQTKTDSHFELDNNALMEFTKDADDKTLSSIIGWWHHHGRYGTFWSMQDSDCFERLCKLSGFCFGLVTSWKGQKFKMRCRLDMRDSTGRRVSIDDIEPEIMNKTYNVFVNPINTIKDEIKELVTEDKRSVCPYCAGDGYISESEDDGGYLFDNTEQKGGKKEWIFWGR